MATRTCVACGLTATADNFSRRQWRKGVGRSRCFNCVAEHDDETLEDLAVIRDEDADEAYFSDEALLEPFDEGGFRWVALGHYQGGSRDGERCVAKWLKDEIPMSVLDYKDDLRCVHRALDFVRAFNAAEIVDIPLRVHVPTMHQFGDDSALAGVVYLREPFIDDYDKWNSNSGWNDTSSQWAECMQALSHFSYHASGGQHVLCDLQGGFKDEIAILTDPAILSTAMNYGSTDMGPSGILTFFHLHECNGFCNPDWDLPGSTDTYIEPVYSTVTVWDTNVEKQTTQYIDEDDEHDEYDEHHHHHHHHHHHYDDEHHHEHHHEQSEETDQGEDDYEQDSNTEGGEYEVSDERETTEEYESEASKATESASEASETEDVAEEEEQPLDDDNESQTWENANYYYYYVHAN